MHLCASGLLHKLMDMWMYGCSSGWVDGYKDAGVDKKVEKVMDG